MQIISLSTTAPVTYFSSGLIGNEILPCLQIHEKRYRQLLGDITGLCENARSVLVETYWQIGKRIVEEEQAGNVNADHGTQLIERLAEDLTANFGSGFSKTL